MKQLPLYCLVIFLAACGGDDSSKAQGVPDNNANNANSANSLNNLNNANNQNNVNNSNNSFDAGADAGFDQSASTCGEFCAYEPEFLFEDIRTLPEFTLTSIADREIPILVRYPADAVGELPVVIWSHGGSWSANGHTGAVEWSTRLARAGYAVIHYSMMRPTEGQLNQICQFAGITDPADCQDFSITGDAPEDDPDFVNPFSANVYTRPADGQAVMDALPRIAERTSQRGITLDISQPVLAGHSAGTQTVLPLAGALRVAADILEPYSTPSDDPAAFVAISPQGPGYSDYFATDEGTSWDNVRGPTLVITGDGDEKPANTLTGAIRRMAFENMPLGDKYLFYSTQVENVRHGTFNLDDLDSRYEDVAALSETLVSVVLAFLDAKIRDREEARAWMESDNGIEMVGGQAEWVSK